jgi:hypothetical protein
VTVVSTLGLKGVVVVQQKHEVQADSRRQADRRTYGKRSRRTCGTEGGDTFGDTMDLRPAVTSSNFKTLGSLERNQKLLLGTTSLREGLSGS